MDIKNKIIIITGGLGGVATATTQVLLKREARYVALFDTEEKDSYAELQLKKFEQEFGEGRVGFYASDVRNRKQFEEKYDEVLKSHKSVDILINLAGILCDADTELEIDVNFKGLVFCTLTAIDKMGIHRGGTGGTVINVSSIAGLMFHSDFPVYGATKHAVVAFTSSLQAHYAKTGVRAMTMCPGLTSTSMIRADSAKPLDFVGHHSTALIENPSQSPKTVGLAIAEMIEKGDNGAIWVSEDNNPPYAIKDLELYIDRAVPIP